MQQLLPEWVPQEAVLLAWPDKHTDWLPWLNNVRTTWLELISQLNRNLTPVIMLIRETEIASCKHLVSHFNHNQSADNQITRLLLLPADYNDTWLRDYGFLTLSAGENKQAISFAFNGWGNKFAADKDNLINENRFADLLQRPLQTVDFVLEGGALEINSEGTLLTTQLCLSNPERNGTFNAAEHHTHFQRQLGAVNTMVLQHGHLQGDDTDGHIDTLVRFTPEHNLVIQSCANRPADSHFEELTKLVAECAELFPQATLFELPLPFTTNTEQERLPASYANFLISNGAVFAPVYQEPEDAQALKTLSHAFPGYHIIPVNCRPLVQQFGSLHCITMQVPVGTLKPQVVRIANSGISVYD